jgi:hypothetical protein
MFESVCSRLEMLELCDLHSPFAISIVEANEACDDARVLFRSKALQADLQTVRNLTVDPECGSSGRSLGLMTLTSRASVQLFLPLLVRTRSA